LCMNARKNMGCSG
ncbi:phage terminase large subunit family protein, partial [Escherichia coli 90.0039]